MNKARQTALEKIRVKLEGLQEELALVLEEEQEFYTSKSDKWQDSEAGETSQEAIDNLESAISSVEEAVDSLHSIENQ